MRVGNVSDWLLSFSSKIFTRVVWCIELNQLTGIAAILTFPLDVEVVEAEEKAAKDAEAEVVADADG